MHLRMKLKHATALQQKAVNMETKEKVQPDVYTRYQQHQIRNNAGNCPEQGIETS